MACIGWAVRARNITKSLMVEASEPEVYARAPSRNSDFEEHGCVENELVAQPNYYEEKVAGFCL